MTKKKKISPFVEVKTLKELNALPDGTRLEWVPGYEEHLQYAPYDIQHDCFLRLWHTFRSKKYGGKRMRKEIKATLKRYRNNRHKLRPRARFVFKKNGKNTELYRSHMTMRCYTGFEITDPKEYVVDHIDRVTLNDKPSNLRVTTPEENTNSSEVRKFFNTFSPKTKRLIWQARYAWFTKRKRAIMNCMAPFDDVIDFELEALQQLTALDERIVRDNAFFRKFMYDYYIEQKTEGDPTIAERIWQRRKELLPMSFNEE